MQLQQSRSPLDHSPIAGIYQRYWLLILNAIRQYIPSREDAEDVLLEVFLAALESEIFVTLNEKQQLAWLRRVASNKSVDHYRRSVRRPAVPLELAAETLFDNEHLSPEQMTLRREEYALLRSHLAKLPDQQQKVLQLRFAHDLPCAEIAVQMQKSEGAVRTLLSRSLNLLRSIYAKNREAL